MPGRPALAGEGMGLRASAACTSKPRVAIGTTDVGEGSSGRAHSLVRSSIEGVVASPSDTSSRAAIPASQRRASREPARSGDVGVMGARDCGLRSASVSAAASLPRPRSQRLLANEQGDSERRRVAADGSGSEHGGVRSAAASSSASISRASKPRGRPRFAARRVFLLRSDLLSRCPSIRRNLRDLHWGHQYGG